MLTTQSFFNWRTSNSLPLIHNLHFKSEAKRKKELDSLHPTLACFNMFRLTYANAGGGGQQLKPHQHEAVLEMVPPRFVDVLSSTFPFRFRWRGTRLYGWVLCVTVLPSQAKRDWVERERRYLLRRSRHTSNQHAAATGKRHACNWLSQNYVAPLDTSCLSIWCHSRVRFKKRKKKVQKFQSRLLRVLLASQGRKYKMRFNLLEWQRTVSRLK